MKKAAWVYGVTERSVRQLIRRYRETGEIPRLNPNKRLKTSLTEEQKAMIDEVWKETRVGTRLLFYELRRRGQRIPHNKIDLYQLLASYFHHSTNLLVRERYSHVCSSS